MKIKTKYTLFGGLIGAALSSLALLLWNKILLGPGFIFLLFTMDDGPTTIKQQLTYGFLLVYGIPVLIFIVTVILGLAIGLSIGTNKELGINDIDK